MPRKARNQKRANAFAKKRAAALIEIHKILLRIASESDENARPFYEIAGDGFSIASGVARAIDLLHEAGLRHLCGAKANDGTARCFACNMKLREEHARAYERALKKAEAES